MNVKIYKINNVIIMERLDLCILFMIIYSRNIGENSFES